MMPSTLTAIRAIATADPSLDVAARARLLASLQAAASPNAITATDRIMRRREAARTLGRSCRSIDMLAAQGVLHKIRLPGRDRFAGFRASDVLALVNGGVAA